MSDLFADITASRTLTRKVRILHRDPRKTNTATIDGIKLDEFSDDQLAFLKSCIESTQILRARQARLDREAKLDAMVSMKALKSASLRQLALLRDIKGMIPLRTPTAGLMSFIETNPAATKRMEILDAHEAVLRSHGFS